MSFDPTKYGFTKVKSNQNVQPGIQPQGVQAQGVQPSPAIQPTQPNNSQSPDYSTLDQPLASFAPPKQGPQPGFFQNAVQSVTRPFLQFGNTVGQLFNQVGGLGSQSSEFQAERNAAQGSDYGYLGRVKPLNSIEQAAGNGLQMGAYAIPELKVIANPILRGAATGATIGAVSGAGNSLSQDGSVGDVVKGTLEGAAAGGATGGIISAAAPVVAGTVKAAGSVAKFATSQVTGFNRNTIQQILEGNITPEVEQVLNREYLGNKVHGAVTTRLDELSSTGKEFQPIRDARSPVEIPTTEVKVPNPVDPKTGAPILDPQTQLPYKSYQVNDVFLTILRKHGLDLNPATGQILTSADSVPLAPGDLEALQRFYTQYGNVTDSNSNIFLNTRKALDNLADYGKDPNRTDISNVIGKQLRTSYDQVGKAQIPGLAEKDAEFAPEKKLMSQIQTDYLNFDGTLKDNALNKIANLGNKGKSTVLQRLENVVPGIGKDVNILRAVEDIKDSSGIKIGTYARGGLAGLILGGGNPMAAFAGMLLSTPSVAVPIIKTFGRAHNIASPLVDNIISRMQGGKPLTDAMKRLIEMAFADITTNGKKTPQEVPQQSGQSTDEYLKSLGI